MIEVKVISRRYGDRLAVDSLTFTVRPGMVTGFLRPNGAGKSTTIRMILGLDRPDAGSVRVNGHRYVDSPATLHEVGALLEAGAAGPGRTAYDHLLAMAATTGIPRRRVDELVELVGIGEVAHKRVGSFSLGMGQRLGIASALLGDPQAIWLDEPVMGLDPDGVLWVRTLLKRIAAEGRTASRLAPHDRDGADRRAPGLVGRGRLIADCRSPNSFTVRRAAASWSGSLGRRPCAHPWGFEWARHRGRT